MTTQPPPGYWSRTTAPQFGARPGSPTNTFAWIGLVISASGFLIPVGINGLLGAVFSLLGMRDARRLRAAGHEETGSSIALAGLIIGIVHIVVTAALIAGSIWLFFAFNDWMDEFVRDLQSVALS
jgi:hypothetical protein